MHHGLKPATNRRAVLERRPPSSYFMNLFHKINLEREIGATTANKETVVMIEMIYQIHKDYRSAIDALSEQIYYPSGNSLPNN